MLDRAKISLAGLGEPGQSHIHYSIARGSPTLLSSALRP